MGCAKKSVVKEEAPVKEETAAVQAGKEGETIAKAEAPSVKTEEAIKPLAAVPTEKEAVTLENIHFDFDKFNLKPEARELLKKHADWLARNENQSIVIEGHCDERGTTEYNLALGERRAAEAMKFLVELGIDAKRLKTISYGEEKPLDPGHNEEAWTKNRRDQFILTPQK